MFHDIVDLFYITDETLNIIEKNFNSKKTGLRKKLQEQFNKKRICNYSYLWSLILNTK
jgi:hypothetical protein